MNSLWNILLATTLFLLLPLHTLASPASDDQPIARYSNGHTCLACVAVVSVIEQLAQVHNSTVEASMERLCSYLPEKLFLKTTCYLVIRMFGPDIIKLLSTDMNADVVCHTLEFCKQDPGQPLCHLYPLPKEAWKFTLEKARQIVKKSPTPEYSRSSSDVCSLPFLAKICQRIKSTIKNSVPFKDVDSDKYSVFPTLRGYHWRGRDCNDSNKMAYPGRRPDDWDVHEDSNCNGIWGVDPKDGIPYEKKFCEGSQPRGIILLGDSAGAHFHISPEWITASQMSLKSFINLPTALTNELDWPQLSGATGFLDSINGIKENSIYRQLRKRNHCNHRDYQNISRNGASSRNLEKFLETLSRNQLLDHPAIVIYAMIGNDVCNGKADPVPEMTTPEKLYSNIMQTLKYLNSHLPNGSHVILYGLPDGTFLWDNLHDRYYPLGQLNKDVTYAHFYSFLNCLQVSPCHSWMSSNKTLRTLTSERAKQLSNTLKKIATSQKFTNFDLFYMDFDFHEVIEEWRKRGGQPWQLIEPVDGFHPNEVASLLLADRFWKKVQLQWPQVLGKENPFNSQIEQVFGDQGGH
ncbi:acyloxyacyl hydrolase isoform X2 [Ursus americanus]|uniref:Acyloxyacyl hydrolase n=1 Tax=Ursus maritimus TaxID=29073 RepID=A0A384BQ78_URSMA|nr:acyloxyacyl hydrolase isoform X1 [Ursus maritimus]XP_026365094.3 acyloxyacyl hydrolase isoform X2 [Ursus arctos]XP_045648816.1 acyloxyacyl hydrolase isoform X2 [Ursus americanus]